MNLGTQVGLGPGHIVLDGDPAPLPKKGRSPQFSAHFYCGQTAGWIKMALGMDGPRSRHIVLDWDPAPPPKKGHSPQFSANVRCGQTAGWIKMPLGTEINLGPGDVVLDGVLAPRERGTAAPSFSAHVYCGHGRPSQLLLSSCFYFNMEPQLRPSLPNLILFALGSHDRPCARHKLTYVYMFNMWCIYTFLPF